MYLYVKLWDHFSGLCHVRYSKWIFKICNIYSIIYRTLNYAHICCPLETTLNKVTISKQTLCHLFHGIFLILPATVEEAEVETETPAETTAGNIQFIIFISIDVHSWRFHLYIPMVVRMKKNEKICDYMIKICDGQNCIKECLWKNSLNYPLTVMVEYPKVIVL